MKEQDISFTQSLDLTVVAAVRDMLAVRPWESLNPLHATELLATVSSPSSVDQASLLKHVSLVGRGTPEPLMKWHLVIR